MRAWGIRINAVFVTHVVFNGKISSFFPSSSRKCRTIRNTMLKNCADIHVQFYYRDSPIGKIVHLIGDKFKPFFWTNWETFPRGNSRISEVIKGKQYQLIRNCNFIYRTFCLVNQDDSPDRKKIVFFLIFHCWWLACSFLDLYKAFFIVNSLYNSD
jgi:hypothetical protein